MTRSVLIVEDHHVVSAGLRAIIEADGAFEVVAEARTEGEAADAVAKLRPELIVMDLRLGDGGDGVAATRAALAQLPGVRVLAMSSFEGDETIHRALEAGARGFVFKSAPAGEILAALAALAAGQRFVPLDVSARLVANGPRLALTAREGDVLHAMARGRRNKEIAAGLGVGEATVRTHVENILGKFGCRDRGAAIAAAIARGFLG